MSELNTIMGKLLDDYRKYMAEATKKQLHDNWEELKKYNEF